MVVVTVIIIISFSMWGSYSTMKELLGHSSVADLGPNVAFRIHGRNHTHADESRLIRTYELAFTLGQGDILMGLAGTDETGNPSLSDFVINLLILRHEARRLGIAASDELVFEKTKAVPAFQTNEQFDPQKYENFRNNWLAPRGLTFAAIHELMRDIIVFERVKEFIGAPAALTAAEREIAERNTAKMDLKILRFPMQAALDATTVREEDVKEEFDMHPDTYKKPEGLVVEVAQFDLPEDKRELTGKERVEAQQEVVAKAAAFAEGATDENFAERAAAAAATVKKTLPIESPTAQRELPPAVAKAAFFLTDARKISVPVESGHSFYVVRIAERVPERQLTLDEARPRIEEMLRNRTARETMNTQAQAAVAKIRAAQKSGASLEDALAATGIEVTELTAVSLDDNALPFQSRMAARNATLLQPGQISNPFSINPNPNWAFPPALDGMEIVALVKREAGEDKDTDLSEIVDSKRSLFFNSWLMSRHGVANVIISQHPRR